jgi:hypothetical protein
MNAKLTLTIEKSVIKQAKEYAESTGVSLSKMIENYLKSFSIQPGSRNKNELSPLIESMKGSFKAPSNFDYKQELKSQLSKKYGS